jgi:hypothetical protein
VVVVQAVVVVAVKTVTVVVVITVVIITVITMATIVMAVAIMAVVRTVTEATAHLTVLHTVHQLRPQLRPHLPSKKQVPFDWRPAKVTGCQSLDYEG